MLEWQERISINPWFAMARLYPRSRELLVSVILDSLAAGVPHEEVLPSYRLPPGIR